MSKQYQSNLIVTLQRFFDSMPAGHALAIGPAGDQLLTKTLKGYFEQFNRRRDIHPGSTLCRIRTVCSRLFKRVDDGKVFVGYTLLVQGEMPGPMHIELSQLLAQHFEETTSPQKRAA